VIVVLYEAQQHLRAMRHPSPELARALEAGGGSVDAAEIHAAIRGWGADARLVELDPRQPERTLSLLRMDRPSVVFNLVDSIGGEPTLAPLVPAYLESVGVPYLGGSALTFAICSHKDRMYSLLSGAGIPVPRSATVDSGAGAARVPFDPPYFVKPAGEHASIGIDEESTAVSPDALRTRLAELAARGFGRVMVDEHLNGPEYSVSFVGRGERMEMLPALECRFRPGHRARTFHGKWQVPNFDLLPLGDVALGRELEAWARSAIALTGARDFVRVEFRADSSGRPKLIDLNPNPFISRASPCVVAAAAGGLGYEDYLRKVLGDVGGIAQGLDR
jgi:D-alanine-D-alanine ligase